MTEYIDFHVPKSTVAPEDPVVGQPWFQMPGEVFKYWDGASWVDLGGAGGAIGATGPTGPQGVLDAVELEKLVYTQNAANTLSGGGTTTTDASANIKWSSRFIPITIGKGANTAVSGYFNIEMPPDGTVITGYGGAANQTVTGGYIPMSVWCALWYELPLTFGNTSLPGNFKLTSYTGTYTVPNNWIRIAQRNSDSPNLIYWGDGRRQGASTTIAVDRTTPDVPSARVKKTTDQTGLVSGAFTRITWDAEDWDNDVIHDNATNNSRLTAKTAGVYLIQGQFGWDGSGTGQSILSFYVNGAEQFRDRMGALNYQEHSASTFLKLSVNDYVEMFIHHSAGVDRAITSSVYTRFGMARLGAG